MQAKEHQIRVVNWLKTHRAIAAIYEVGSGKTLIGVMASQCFLDANPKSKVIVIAPKSLIGNFQKEMVAYGVMNSERYVFHTFQSFQKSQNACNACANDMVIIDEAHELRTVPNMSKKNRSYQALLCTKCARKVLLLTATPFVNSMSDLKNIVAMIRGEETVPSKKQFDQILNNPQMFRRYLQDIFIYYSPTKEGYPEARMNHVEIPMHGDYLQMYEEIEEKNDAALARQGITGDPFAFYTGMRTALLKLPSSDKIKFAEKKALEVYRMNKKIVIYSNFKEAGTNIIATFLLKERVPFGLIDGTIKAHERDRIVRDYNSGKIKVLLITKAAGMGLDLKETRAIIVLDVPWNETNLKQVIGRAARFQSHVTLPPEEQYVDIYILYAIKPNAASKDSADSYLRSAIAGKTVEGGKATGFIQASSVALSEQQQDDAWKILTRRPTPPPAAPKRQRAVAKKLH